MLKDRIILTAFLEITVEGNSPLDLSEFVRSLDAGVLLEGAGDTETLRGNREILQGRPKVVKGGQSATMVYSNSYTLVNRSVAATFDLSCQLRLLMCFSPEKGNMTPQHSRIKTYGLDERLLRGSGENWY